MLEKWQRLILSGIFIFCTFLVYPNTEKILRFSHISTNEGLSDNTIFCYFQDSNDFLWLGTNHGLNRYDGIQFKHFYKQTGDTLSIGDNIIWSIAEDSTGYLWLGTHYGIDIFDASRERVVRHISNLDPASGLPDKSIKHIFKDSRNRMWIGTSKGMAIYSSDAKLIHTMNPESESDGRLSDNEIKGIAEDSLGNIWVATGNGLNRISGAIDEVEHFYSNSGSDPTIAASHPSTVFIDSEGLLWLGSESGHIEALRWSKDSGLEQKYPLENELKTWSSILAIQEDDNGQIWMATKWGGLLIYCKKEDRMQSYVSHPDDPHGISWNVLLSLHKTKCGTMWIGSFGAGGDYWHPSLQKFNLYQLAKDKQNALTIESVQALILDTKNRIWISGFGGSNNLNVFDRKNGQTKINFPDGLGHITGFHLDQEKPDKYLWMTTNSNNIQLFKYDLEKDEIEKSYALVDEALTLFDIHERGQTIWICSSAGIIEFSKQTEELVVHRQMKPPGGLNDKNSVYCVLIDKPDDFWVGTRKGLYRYNPINQTFKAFYSDRENPQSLSSNYVLDLAKDANGYLWVATNNGLCKLDIKTGLFKQFSLQNELKSNLIIEMETANNGDIWMCSNRGLTRLNPEKEEFTHFDVNDGLQSNDFSQGASFVSAEGELFFGGIKGFNSFFPEDVLENEYRPSVYFTDIQLFNQSVLPGQEVDGKVILDYIPEYQKELRFDHKHDVISFEFAALNYILPSKNQYAYKLEGLDESWNFIDTRNRITFTNLDPKTYYLRVKAANNDGVWNEAGTELKIIVAPPFYHTWWFRILAFVLIAGMIYGYYHFKVRGLKLSERRLAEQVAKRTAELQEANTLMEEKNEEVLIQKELLEERNKEISNKSEEILAQNEELERHRYNLKQLVDQRTKELREAIVKAEESDRLKTAFLANMSHEIRTPMNAIIGFSSLIINPEIADEEKEMFYSQIHTNSEALLILIDDIIDTAKIESGQLKLSMQKVELNKLFLELQATFKQELDRKSKSDIQLKMHIPEESSVLYTDPYRLKQIMTNLLSNAVKYTDKGTIDFGFSFQKPGVILFNVIDTGIGIPANKLASIFNRFEKVEHAGERLFRGTGLGLSISRHLVELLGGTIHVTSEENIGSEFFFTLPLQK